MIVPSSRFYVVDFDRCLGNIEASFEVLRDIVHERGIVDSHVLTDMRRRVEATGGSFSVIQSIRELKPDSDLEIVSQLYMQRTLMRDMLEPGAKALIEYLQASGSGFCIMSYGEASWQLLKIRAAGLGDIPIRIVSSRDKSRYVSEWWDASKESFVIPPEINGGDNEAKVREVIVIDDKPVAFEHLSSHMRGYLVHGTRPVPEGLPTSVVVVENVGDIALIEARS